MWFATAAPFFARGLSLAISTFTAVSLLAALSRELDQAEFAVAGLILGLSQLHPILEAGTGPVFVNDSAKVLVQGKGVGGLAIEQRRMVSASRVLLVVCCSTVVVAGGLSVSQSWSLLFGVSPGLQWLDTTAGVALGCLGIVVLGNAGAAIMTVAGKQWVVSLAGVVPTGLALVLVLSIPWTSDTGLLPVATVSIAAAITSMCILAYTVHRWGLPFEGLRVLLSRRRVIGSRVRGMLVPSLLATLFSVLFYASDRFLMARWAGLSQLPLYLSVSPIALGFIALSMAAGMGLWGWDQRQRAESRGATSLGLPRIVFLFTALGVLLSGSLMVVTPWVAPLVLGYEVRDWIPITAALASLVLVTAPLLALENLLKERDGLRIKALVWPMALILKLAVGSILVAHVGGAGIIASGTIVVMLVIVVEVWAVSRTRGRSTVV